MNEKNYLIEYLLDPENPETNFNLATEYFSIGQTAAALSFFLRCADRSGDDLDLAYECLIHIGKCFDIQGNRFEHVRCMYKHAMSILPKRPEAYYMLANFQNWHKQFQDAYYLCKQSLEICDFDPPKLRLKCGYPGKWGILYEKVVSSWWWGKTEEHKEGLLDLRNMYFNDLDDYHKNSVQTKIKNLNIEVEKIDVVLQGQYNEFTNTIIENYLNLPFVNRIILSCWNGDDPLKLETLYEKYSERLIVIFNEKPFTYGDDNINLQIVSSYNGICKVDTEYAIKMRTDQLYDYNSMMVMYDFFIHNRKEHLIFVSGMYPHLLFHPRDHLFWGKASDLIKLFNIPLKINNVTDKVRIPKQDLWKYYGYFIRAETYLGANYCSNFDDKIKLFLIQPEKYLFDGSSNWQESLEVSNKVTKNLFKSFPRTNVDLSWPKKNLNSYPYENQKYQYNECWHEDGF